MGLLTRNNKSPTPPTLVPKPELSPVFTPPPSPVATASPSEYPSGYPTSTQSHDPTGNPTPSPSGAPTHHPSQTPSSSPSSTPTNQADVLLNALSQTTDPLVLMNATTPQGMAFNWLLNDPHCSDPVDCATIQQRYALAVLYFATNGSDWTYNEDA